MNCWKSSVPDMDGGKCGSAGGRCFPGQGPDMKNLVGDKFFYGYGYDDNYRMQYAYVDVNTKEKEKITHHKSLNIK